MTKKISNSDIIGKQGIDIISEIIHSMGLLFYPTGGVEAGIDGYIEIRDPDTGEVTNSIIQVQSKATTKNRLLAETDTSFEHRCEQRDIDYWLQGNAPVILIVVRVNTKEAYWISLKDYFEDNERKISRKIQFYKHENCLNTEARASLIRLAIPQFSGLYLAPRPKQELLYSNLLRVSGFGDILYTAFTKTDDVSKASSDLLKIGRRKGQEWILRVILFLASIIFERNLGQKYAI